MGEQLKKTSRVTKSLIVDCDSCRSSFLLNVALMQGVRGIRIRCRKCGAFIDVENPERPGSFPPREGDQLHYPPTSPDEGLPVHGKDEKESEMAISEDEGEVLKYARLKWWIFGIITVFIIANIVAFYIYQKSRKDPVTARQLGAPIPVKVYTTKARDISLVVGASGTSKEFTTVNLIANIVAPIKSVKSNVGEIVEKGQELAVYDGTVLLSELESAETMLNKAAVMRNNSKLNMQRVSELFDKKLVARVELEKAQLDYSSAKAAYNEAKYNYDRIKRDTQYLHITSPIQGIVLERYVSPGETPAVKSPLFKLGLIENIFIAANVPEQYVGDIAVGQAASVVFDSYPNTAYNGVIYKIDANINPETRAFLSYIMLKNKELKLKPGMTGFSKISFKKNVIAIPNLAIINPTGQRATVFVVGDDNVALLREIKIGAVDGNVSEVLSGLNPGEKIAAVGNRGLQNKDKVRIWEEVF